MHGNVKRQDEIVVLPSNRQRELLLEDGLDRLGVPRALEKLGCRMSFLDVHAAPLNPLAGRPSLFSSIDPLRALTVLLRHRRATAVISYYQSGALPILALRQLFFFKPRVAIVDIGDDVGWAIRTRIVKYCVERADAVFCFASEQADALRRRYGVENVHFLPQQVDTEFFTPASDGEGEGILSVGGDVSRDYATMEEAVFSLGVPVVLRTGLVAEQPNYPHITVIRERQSDVALRTLYRQARIVVLPLKDMLHPGGITTLLEAYACGKAVVASASRGIKDYLRHEEICLTVPCGDTSALRAATLRLLNDDALRTRLEKAARAYAEQELSQERHAGRLLAAIRRL